MLVLTRGINETIVIGEGIEIMIVAVKGRKVKLGVRAPLDIPVHRKEVYVDIQKENIEAARSNSINQIDLKNLSKFTARKN
ncbi:MAG: carbon storage regulator CsrA [Planctomycetes bacterium]|nr:carbon storage regulator CsrA [Planctomycetota bacterium]